MLLKACPRCRKLIPYGQPYCPDCAPIAEAERAAAAERKAEARRKRYNREYNHKRDPKYTAFYRTKAWRLTSRAKLQAAAYRCQAALPGCSGLASEVHHVQPIKTPGGWEARLDWSNLMAVCPGCHNHLDARRHRRDDGILDLKSVKVPKVE